MKFVYSIIFLFIFGANVICGETRVVSFAPALTELVFKLGQGTSLVGRSAVCDYPEAVRQLPVAGNFGQPNVEKTLQLRPTLIIANDFIKPETARIFRQAGIKVELHQSTTVQDYLFWVKRLGDLLGCSSAASQEIQRFEIQLRQLKRGRNKLPKKPSICWVIWDRPLMIAGGNSLPDFIIRTAGGRNVGEKITPAYFKASTDWLLKIQPEVLIWTCSRKLNRQHRFWKNLAAVKNNRVIELPDCAILLRPGPRLPAGIALIQNRLLDLP